MYIPRSFRLPDREAVRFVEANPFAVLFSATATGEPIATHLPLVFSAAANPRRVVGHLALANDHWRHLDNARVLAVFSGPHAYIAPTWYESMPNVPTWNYVAVHIHGTCRVVREPGLRLETITRLTRAMEPDSPIPAALMAEDHPDHRYYRQLVEAVVAVEILVDRIEGKAKLGQNHTPSEREAVIRHLAAASAAGPREIAEAMANLLPSTYHADSDSPEPNSKTSARRPEDKPLA